MIYISAPRLTTRDVRTFGESFSRRTIASVAISTLIGASVAVLPAMSASAVNVSCSGFDSTAQSTTTGLMLCDVPTGVTSLQVVVTGAGGGGGGGSRTSTGGSGSVVATTLAVTAGETLSLQVGTGGGGVSTASGGGGGGWSAILRSATPLVVAGAGGGGGSASSSTNLSSSIVYAGGNGGTPNASPGTPSTFGGGGDSAGSGGGATTTAGGTAGPSTGQAGSVGQSGQGGRGGEPCSGGGSFGGNGWQGGGTANGCGASTGGGGGGGYFGGGGGGGTYGSVTASGSGGGGSSYISSGSATYSVATNGGAVATAGGFGSIVFAVPVVAPPAPTNVAATSGTSAAVVSWTAPSPSTGVTGYTVTSFPGSATCMTTSVSATSCVIGGTAGTAYTYTVIALSSAGNSPASSGSTAVTPSSPSVPATVPTSAPTTLTTTDGAITTADPGQRITVVGTGFLPFSSATIIAYSSPIVLAMVVTDGSGNFSAPVTVPSSLAVGAHNLVASGVDPAGGIRLLRLPFSVRATLAATGPNSWPMAGFAVLLLVAGVGAMHVSRRRIRVGAPAE